jgi:DeoR/GlpR family transcriptional regulator of sugar metabolism
MRPRATPGGDRETIVRGGVAVRDDALVGPIAEFGLQQINPQLTILDVAGLDPRVGYTCAEQAEVGVRRPLAHPAPRLIVVAPPDAWGRNSLGPSPPCRRPRGSSPQAGSSGPVGSCRPHRG